MLNSGDEPVQGFRLRSRLGAGAFGEVWEAVGPTGSSVALKFIDSRKRDVSVLRTEIRVLHAVSDEGHPNLIRLHGVYASSHYLVLCMERADGNLHELRQTYREVTGRNIPTEHLLDMLGQAAGGLDFIAGLKLPGFNLASAGLQHCDVKPSNLLLVGDVVKVADFGLCAGLGSKTHHEGWRGTLPYAAPELYRGRPSSSTDQFALAVTYCDLVAGERMLREADTVDGLNVPVDLGKARGRERPVLARALSADPTLRWPSCRAFVSALREAALRRGSSVVRRALARGATRPPPRP